MSNLLLMSLPEASEAAFFLRMRDVDDFHGQPCEPVRASERPPEGMHVGYIHPGTSSPESHRKRVQMTLRWMLAGRPAEHAHPSSFAGAAGAKDRRAACR